MASSVGFSEAWERLGELLDRVEHGEEIVIERDGRAMSKLVPVAEPKLERRIGGQNLLGVSYIAPGFDEPMSLEEAAPVGRTLAECIALLPEDSVATIDEDFAGDVAAAIEAHRKPLDASVWD
jgi:antitoxin (DNA-binding transcriptional repressor) of toxin-antitoxin stability system